MTEDIIVDAVCEWYEITPRQLLSRRRVAPLVDARATAAVLMLEFTPLSQRAIGLKLGRADHTAVSHYKQLVYGQADIYADARRRLETLRNSVRRRRAAAAWRENLSARLCMRRGRPYRARKPRPVPPAPKPAQS